MKDKPISGTAFANRYIKMQQAVHDLGIELGIMRGVFERTARAVSKQRGASIPLYDYATAVHIAHSRGEVRCEFNVCSPVTFPAHYLGMTSAMIAKQEAAEAAAKEVPDPVLAQAKNTLFHDFVREEYERLKAFYEKE